MAKYKVVTTPRPGWVITTPASTMRDAMGIAATERYVASGYDGATVEIRRDDGIVIARWNHVTGVPRKDRWPGGRI